MNDMKKKEIINRLNSTCVLPLEGGTFIEPPVIGAKRHYSIFIPIVEREGETCLLFELRSNTIERQPGEVCFPGGMVEEGESYWEAAIRETMEELGIGEYDREFVQICGQIGIMSQYQGSVIHCYYGTILEELLDKLAPSKDEVAELFYVPVNWLLKNSPKIYQTKIMAEVPEDFPYELIGSEKNYKWGYGIMNIPIWKYEKYGIWGLTGRVTMKLIEHLKDKGIE